MTSRNIIFNNEDFFFNPNKSIQSFYQICMYKDVHKDMYAIRKIKFDETMKIVDVKVKYYSKKVVNKFIEKNKNSRENKMRMYPYTDIAMVPYPNMSELNESYSSLLNGVNSNNTIF